MILSKGNLQVVTIAADDKQIAGLNNVLIEKDGSTVAVNRNTVMIVSPVMEKIKQAVPLDESENEDAIVISAETIKEVLKNIPKDVMFKGLLEYCDVNSNGTFTTTDGKRKRRIEGKKYDRIFIDHKKLIGEGEPVFHAVLNFKRLMSLFVAINKICPDVAGESVVLLEFMDNGKVTLKAKNMKNDQQVAAITTTYAYKQSDWIDFFKPLTSIKTTRIGKRRKIK